MPDEKGETRRERNERVEHGHLSPLKVIPDAGRYIWDWYFDLSDSLTRIRDGVCSRIPPSEFIAWREATGAIVYPVEYATLSAMDAAYCAEMNRELAALQERQAEAAREAAKQG